MLARLRESMRVSSEFIQRYYLRVARGPVSAVCRAPSLRPIREHSASILRAPCARPGSRRTLSVVVIAAHLSHRRGRDGYIEP